MSEYSGSTDPIKTSYAGYTYDRHMRRAKLVSRRRLYYKGRQINHITERQKKSLVIENLQNNYCGDVVNVPVDRMNVTGWSSQSGSADAELLASQIAKNNRTRFSQSEVYRNSLRDGSGYILIEPIPTRASGLDTVATWTIHPREYLDHNGTVYGVRMHLDKRRTPVFASLRWHDESEDAVTRERKTLYYPDVIEDYAMTTKPGTYQEAGWKLIDETPWVDADGSPLGIAMIEYRCPGGSRLTESILDAQDHIIQLWLYALGVGYFHGWPMLAVSTSHPLDEIVVGPGEMIKLGVGDTAERIQAGDAQAVLDLISAKENDIIRESKIPSHLVKQWGATPPTGESLKAQDVSLLQLVGNMIAEFTLSWEAVQKMSFKIERFYNTATWIEQGDYVTPVWGPTREVQLGETLQRVQVAQLAGVDPRTVFIDILGYSPEKADKMIELLNKKPVEPEVQNNDNGGNTNDG